MAGSSLTFTIDISEGTYLDTPHIVLVSWTRDETIVTNGARITVSNVSSTNDSNLYQAQLMFSVLSSTIDSGMYVSNVSVSSIPSYPYITSALPTTKMASINVTGKNSFDVVVIVLLYSNLYT